MQMLVEKNDQFEVFLYFLSMTPQQLIISLDNDHSFKKLIQVFECLWNHEYIGSLAK